MSYASQPSNDYTNLTQKTIEFAIITESSMQYQQRLHYENGLQDPNEGARGFRIASWQVIDRFITRNSYILNLFQRNYLAFNEADLYMTIIEDYLVALAVLAPSRIVFLRSYEGDFAVRC